jgi:hypothetical protein
LESKKAALEQEKGQLEQSLKVLKVLNFLCNNQDLISSQGLRLVMKSGPSGEEEANQQKTGSPGKLADLNQADDF